MCWLATKITGDLFVSQRIISSLFSIIFTFVLMRMIRNASICFTKGIVARIFVFLCNPWILELALSVHLDIIPITLILGSVTFALKQRNPFTFLITGFIIGASYWFRFHFLTYAMFFPVIVYLLTKHNKTNFQAVVCAVISSVISISIPHVLCMAAFGVFSISNEKFVLAYALGVVDWTYESALKLESISTSDLFRNFVFKMYILKYCYHFIKSGLFPLLSIFSIFIYECFKKK
jgi:hypothetical protein